jgi:hypothetical protein
MSREPWSSISARFISRQRLEVGRSVGPQGQVSHPQLPR